MSFRLSGPERGKGEARALRAGCSINELARRAFLATLEAPPPAPVSTRDAMRVEYDE